MEWRCIATLWAPLDCWARSALRGIPPLIAGLPQTGKPEARLANTPCTREVLLQLPSRRMPACPTMLGTHRRQICNRCDQYGFTGMFSRYVPGGCNISRFHPEQQV
jgi:hypothetical protein